MAKRIRLFLFTVLFIPILLAYTPIHVLGQEANVKDCLEGNADCPEIDDSVVDQDRENTEVVSEPNNFPFLNLVKTGFALFIVLAIIYVLLKFLSKRSNLFQQVKVLENLGGISVGQNKSIQIVRIGEKLYLVGVGDNVELLEEITDEKLKTEILSKQTAEDNKSPNFLNTIFGPNKNNSSQFNNYFQNELSKLKETRKKIMDQRMNKEDRHE